MPQITRGKKYWIHTCSSCGRKECQAVASVCECGGSLLRPGQTLAPTKGVIPDDIPGGMVMEHLIPGRKVYSRTEHNQVIAEYNKQHGTDWRVSDYGNTGVTDQHFIKASGLYVDLRTREQRQREMAEFLGLTYEEYLTAFA